MTIAGGWLVVFRFCQAYLKLTQGVPVELPLALRVPLRLGPWGMGIALAALGGVVVRKKCSSWEVMVLVGVACLLLVELVALGRLFPSGF
jgi:hypothetical protein